MTPLDELEAALARLRAGEVTPAQFVALARGHAAALPALPPRYGEVLGRLLDSIESSALFSGESCSFSDADLLDGLAGWITQARARLAPV